MDPNNVLAIVLLRENGARPMAVHFVLLVAATAMDVLAAVGRVLFKNLLVGKVSPLIIGCVVPGIIHICSSRSIETPGKEVRMIDRLAKVEGEKF